MASHNHRKCVEGALRDAEAICKARGLRLTESRKRVLKLVWGGHKAVKAYDLIARFDNGKGKTKPPTVYRALDFLLENNLIHRIESLNAFVGCSHPGGTHEGNFLICQICHEITEIEEPVGASSLDKLAKKQGFSVNAKTVEIHGTCEACAGKAA